MERMRRATLGLVGLPALLFGCGGQGVGSAPGDRTLLAYAAAESSKTYSHIWVTIERVSVTNGLTSDEVFSSLASTGLKLDLTTLHGKLGPQYLFLGTKDFPAGLFTRAEVTVSEMATLVTKAGESRNVKFPSARGSSVTWALDLTKTKPSVPGTNVVVDFDIGHWSETAGVLKAPKDKFVLQGDGGGLMDPQRHASQTLTGVVQDLTGAGEYRDFTLVTASGSVEVRCRTAKSAPPFAEGAEVKATGAYDPAASIFNADKLEPANLLAGPRPPMPLRKNKRLIENARAKAERDSVSLLRKR